MVSGRTDIVAFYTKWFMKRYREGFVDVRNPFNPKLVSRIYFANVEAILFCTKNPIPIIDHLKEIDKKFYFMLLLLLTKEILSPMYHPKKRLLKQ